MTETCYSKGKKIILITGRKENGKWVCRITIPEFRTSELARYHNGLPEEFETEWEAKTATFHYAQRMIDSSH